MKNTLIISLIALIMIGCTPDQEDIIYYPSFKNARIVGICSHNGIYEKIYYWDLADSTKKYGYIDECFKDSLVIGKIY